MPSNSLIGAIRVEASIDAGKFVTGAKQLSNVSKIAERDVKSAFSGISTAVKGGIAGFTGALSVAGLIELTKGGLDYAKSLQTISQQLGITTKDLQTMRFAAAQVGVTNDQLENGFQFLEKSMGKANAGSVQMQKAFESVGVSLADLKTKTPTEIFDQVADGMAKQGGAAKNAAAATAIFGKSASDLNPLLDQGSRGIDGLRQAAEDLGIVLSEDQIRNANVTATKLTELKEVLQADISAAVVQNAGAINTLADGLAGLIRVIGQSIDGWRRMKAEFEGGLPGLAIGFAAGGVGGALAGYSQGAAAADKRFDFNQQWQRILAGNSAFGRPARSPVNIPQFLGTPKQASGASKKQPADRSDELLAQFKLDELQAQKSILDAQQQLAASAEQRLQLSVASINLDKLIQDAQIDEKVDKAKRQLAAGQITDTAYREVVREAAIEKAQVGAETAIKLRALVEQQLAQHETDLFNAAEQTLKFQEDALHTADQLATTAADHRRIQLQILDLEIEQQRLQLEKNKLDAIRNGATADQIKLIQDQIDNLPNQRAQQAALINRNNQDPLQAWAQQVPKTAAEINEALQSIEVKGLDGLSEAISGIITGTESMKEAFHNLAMSVLQDLIQMTIKMLIFKALTAVFGSAIGGSAGGGTATLSDLGLPSDIGSGASGDLTGFATGGAITVGGRAGTDQNLLSLNGIPIARVSMGEHINISNDNDRSIVPPIQIVTHIDATGADPAELARLRMSLDQMNATLPARVVAAYSDAVTRNVIRK